MKTPRFDNETGAQTTTVFDFRPLVTRLIEEMNQDKESSNSMESLLNVNNQNSPIFKKALKAPIAERTKTTFESL